MLGLSPRRGREHFVFYERSEIKYLVIRGKVELKSSYLPTEKTAFMAVFSVVWSNISPLFDRDCCAILSAYL